MRRAAMLCLAGLASAGCRIHFDESGSDGNPESPPGCVTISGQLAYYPMAASDFVGSQLLDHSGNMHTAVLVGTPPPVPGTGMVGGGIAFSPSTTSYVTLPNVPLPSQQGDALTIALWFNLSSIGATYVAL